MDAQARAGIDIFGATLRYAEVEQYGARYRLLRLGSCDFDFDAGHELLTGEHPEHLATLCEAIGDVFAGTIASQVQVTLHPPGCYSFFTAFPVATAAADRKMRLQQEAALLGGVEEPLRLTADAVYTETLAEGDEVDWVHVLAVPEPVHQRFSDVLGGLPEARRRLMVSMQAAASAVARVRPAPADGEAPFGLAIGWYPTHVEYSLTRGPHWHYSHYAEAGAPADSAYFALALLQRLGLRPEEVGHLYLYGLDADPGAFAVLSQIFPVVPERLNPLSVVDLDPGSLSADFDAEAYVACLGAAL